MNAITPSNQPSLPAFGSFQPPLAWESFVGQPKAKELLTTTLEAARIRGSLLPHALFYGNAGCGKTSLARTMASHAGYAVIVSAGQYFTNERDIVTLAFKLWQNISRGFRTLVFIDEIHRLVKRSPEETWLLLLEYFAIPNRYSGQTIKCPEAPGGTLAIPVADTLNFQPFCMVGATTQPGTLSDAFRRRFRLTVDLEPYTQAEIETIARNRAAQDRIPVTEDAIGEIASRSRLTPARAISHVQTCDDRRLERSWDQITQERAIEALEIAGYGPHGLMSSDRLILKALSEHLRGMGVNNLCQTAGVERGQYEHIVEPWLKQAGFITTDNKTHLTDKGRELLGIGERHGTFGGLPA